MQRGSAVHHSELAVIRFFGSPGECSYGFGSGERPRLKGESSRSAAGSRRREVCWNTS